MIYFFTKHKSKTVLNSFVKIEKESNRKQNKFWVDQGMEFYNKHMQERLDNDNILVIAERFIKILTAKIYKKMTADDSKPYISYLDKLVDQYNNTYHHSISKKAINVDYLTFAEKIETNPTASKFKVNDRVRIIKYKNILVKDTLIIGQEKYLLSILR